MPLECTNCGNTFPKPIRGGISSLCERCRMELSGIERLKDSEKAELERVMALYRESFPNPIKRNYDMWRAFLAGYNTRKDGK